MTGVWRMTLSAPPQIGGKEIHVEELSRVQAQTREVVVHYAWGDPETSGDIRWRRVRGVPRRAPAALHGSWFACRVVLRLLRNRRSLPGYVHAHADVYEAVVLSLLRRTWGRCPPVLITVHAIPGSSRVARALWRRPALRASRFVAVSSAVASAIHTHSKGAISCVVQSSGVRSEFFAAAPSPPSMVVAVGSLTPRRDFMTIVDGVAESRSRPPLRIFGEGESRDAIEAHAERRGVRCIIGRAAGPGELARALREAVYVHARYESEGFPTAVLEALASKCFVLTPPFAGREDYLEDGVNCATYESAITLGQLIDDAMERRDPPVQTRVPTWHDVAHTVDAIVRA